MRGWTRAPRHARPSPTRAPVHTLVETLVEPLVETPVTPDRTA